MHASTAGRWPRAVTRLVALPVIAVTIAALAPMPAHAAARFPVATVTTAAARDVACAEPTDVSQQDAWPQQLLAPQRAWPFTRGDGITVAVLASGVDANHPQLRGRVSAGLDAIDSTGTAQDDCLGTGTQVAGVIAARPAAAGGFAGVAPNATILPIRVAAAASSGVLVAQPDVLARGINAAVQLGAKVIAVATITYTDAPELRGAVDDALAKGIIVVAAVGDLGGANDANPDPYPAMYPGVLGVGAVDRTGQRWTKSQHGGYVDLVAPGVAVTTLQRGQGAAVVDGTGIACGFVAGAAALVRARRGAGVPADDIRRVLLATAIPTAGGANYGRGIVNPYAALSEQVVNGTPAALPVLVRPDSDPSSVWAHSRNVAIAGTGAALLAVLVVALAALALPRGRRRLWRSALAPTPRTERESEEPGPPVLLFAERAPAGDRQ